MTNRRIVAIVNRAVLILYCAAFKAAVLVNRHVSPLTESDPSMTVFLAAFFKPFVLLAVLVFFWAVRTAVGKLPDCWLKRILLLRV